LVTDTDFGIRIRIITADTGGYPQAFLYYLYPYPPPGLSLTMKNPFKLKFIYLFVNLFRKKGQKKKKQILKKNNKEGKWKNQNFWKDIFVHQIILK